MNRNYRWIPALFFSLGLIASGGNIVLTGHDSDFHEVTDDSSGGGGGGGANGNAGKQLAAIMSFVRSGSANPSLKVLSFDSGSELTGALASLGIPFDNIDPNNAAAVASVVFNPLVYSAIVVASQDSCGGCDNSVTGMANLAARKTDIGTFLNAGGGIAGLAGADNPHYYDFVPIAAPNPGGSPGSSGYVQTADGALFGIPPVNGDETHNVFNDPGTAGVSASYKVLERLRDPVTGVAETLGCRGCTVGTISSQPCPAGITNPLSVLDGTNWAFHTESTDYGQSGVASIGTFQPTIKNGVGVLNVTETVIASLASSERRATIQGRYTVYPDCTGGELMFMLSEQPIQFEFIFTHNFTQIVMVADSNNGPAGLSLVTKGHAVLGAPTGCPAGLTNPLSLLDGATWEFSSRSAYSVGEPHSASIGIFKPVFKNGAGSLTVTETVTQSPGLQVSRLGTYGGRYLIYPDCSGGEIMFMNADQPVQYEFVFNNLTFSGIYMLSDVTGGLDVIRGAAEKQ